MGSAQFSMPFNAKTRPIFHDLIGAIMPSFILFPDLSLQLRDDKSMPTICIFNAKFFSSEGNHTDHVFYRIYDQPSSYRHEP